MCQGEGTHQIVMSFTPSVVGCLLKKAHKRGVHRHPRTPLATPCAGQITCNLKMKENKDYCCCEIILIAVKVDIAAISLDLEGGRGLSK